MRLHKFSPEGMGDDGRGEPMDDKTIAYNDLYAVRQVLAMMKYEKPQDDIRLVVSDQARAFLAGELHDIDGMICPCGQCGKTVDVEFDFRPVYAEGVLVRFCGCAVVMLPEVSGHLRTFISQAVPLDVATVAALIADRDEAEASMQRQRAAEHN